MMKGFDLYINNHKISAAVKRGTVLIIINDTNIIVTGIDNDTFQSVSWVRAELNLKDKIKIIASDMNENTPFEAEQLDRQKLLAEYKELKRILTQEGLLK